MEYNCILRVLLNKSLQSETLRALVISFATIFFKMPQGSFRAEVEIIAILICFKRHAHVCLMFQSEQVGMKDCQKKQVVGSCCGLLNKASVEVLMTY